MEQRQMLVDMSASNSSVSIRLDQRMRCSLGVQFRTDGYSAQTALREWKLRGIERSKSWTQPALFVDLHRLRDLHETLEDRWNDPPDLPPNRATCQHRQWWARREISFPL